MLIYQMVLGILNDSQLGIPKNQWHDPFPTWHDRARGSNQGGHMLLWNGEAGQSGAQSSNT
jgi:hypothetical protein